MIEATRNKGVTSATDVSIDLITNSKYLTDLASLRVPKIV